MSGDAKWRATALDRARQALMAVAMDCNTDEKTCSCCNARRYVNYDDQQLFERLSGMVGKLDRDIERLKKESGSR